MNKMDDYEQGTYIASITPQAGGSITLNPGYDDMAYVKIGDLVNVFGRVRVSSVSSPSGEVHFSLPFTSSNLAGDAGRVSGVCYVQNGTQNLNEYGIHPTLEGNAYVQIGRTNGTAFNNVIGGDFGGNELIYISVTYRAA